MNVKLIFLIASLVVIVQAIDENYCDPTLCDGDFRHTACDHYLEFAEGCGDEPEVVNFSPSNRKLILDVHNQYRNKIASGRLPGYAPAMRMPALKWNEDLSYIAGEFLELCGGFQ